MPIVPLRHRFEITIKSENKRFKHVCSALEEAEAVERVMRSYKKLDAELLNVKRLGALPAKLRR
jgi:hypothetical protein